MFLCSFLSYRRDIRWPYESLIKTTLRNKRLKQKIGIAIMFEQVGLYIVVFTSCTSLTSLYKLSWVKMQDVREIPRCLERCNGLVVSLYLCCSASVQDAVHQCSRRSDEKNLSFWSQNLRQFGMYHDDVPCVDITRW